MEAKIFLEGAYTGGTPTMRTTLQTLGYLPTTAPYTDKRVVDPLPPNVVDWVCIQLRTTYNGPAVVERSAFVRNDGKLIDDDGDTVVKIACPMSGYYYVVVSHRNHLAVMSRVPINLGTGSSMLYDFTDGQNKAYGYKAMKDLGGRKYGLVAGDVAVKFGIVDISDLKAIELDLGKAGYLLTDVRLQGTVDWPGWTTCYNNYGRVTKVPKSW